MLSALWVKIVASSYKIGAVLLIVVASIARFQAVKSARDRAVLEADTLKAVVHANKIKRKIVKEEEEKLSAKRADLIKKIKDIKEGKKSEGLDNLTNPNDY